MPAPSLPMRHRQTGLDAKRVIPELLRLRFYFSWIRNFSFLFKKYLFVFVWLSTISPCWFLWYSFSFPFLVSFSFFSFFLGFLTFTTVS
jgi:hypothetical protein